MAAKSSGAKVIQGQPKLTKKTAQWSNGKLGTTVKRNPGPVKAIGKDKGATVKRPTVGQTLIKDAKPVKETRSGQGRTPLIGKKPWNGKLLKGVSRESVPVGERTIDKPVVNKDPIVRERPFTSIRDKIKIPKDGVGPTGPVGPGKPVKPVKNQTGPKADTADPTPPLPPQPTPQPPQDEPAPTSPQNPPKGGHGHHGGHGHGHHHPHFPVCVSTLFPPVIVHPTYLPPPVFVEPTPMMVSSAPVMTATPVMETTDVEELLTLVVGQSMDLSTGDLGGVPTAAALELRGVALPVSVMDVTSDGLRIDVPKMGLSEPTVARLYLFDSNMNPLVETDVRLVTASR